MVLTEEKRSMGAKGIFWLIPLGWCWASWFMKPISRIEKACRCSSRQSKECSPG